MSLEEQIVIIVRLFGSLPVVYFPFFGSLFAILVDLSDLFIIGSLLIFAQSSVIAPFIYTIF